jgi:CzcA family heavy metal efflux pump
MLAGIVRTALRFPLLMVALAGILLAVGIVTALEAKYDVFPEFVPPQADIQAEAPGLAPEEVERLITQPLENAINGGANIAVVRSESSQGLAAINIVFDEASDVFRDRQLLAERVQEAALTLPPGSKPPILGPMISSTMDLLKLGFTSSALTPMELRTLVDWTVRPRLLAVPGVARAIVYGGERREIQIQLHPERLTALAVSVSDVLTAAAAATGLRGAGYVDTPNQRVLVMNSGAARTPADIAAVVVTQHEGTNVLLGDVATVRYAPEPAFGEARVQGRPDVLMSISSQYGANTLEVTRRVEAALAELAPIFRERGVYLYPALHRPANFIEVALRNMRDSVLLGTLLVVLVLIAFLRNWRTALISFVTIPLSLFAAVIVVHRLGWTINTMTLGGLAVAVGVVVDDAIIDVENIVRRLRLAAQQGHVGRLDAVILSASIEVRRPIVLATLVVGLVFSPILLLPGLQGSFFAPLAAAFLFATVASLVVALTVTPALCLLLLRATTARTAEPRWLRRLKIAHHRLLRRSAPHSGVLLAASLVLGALALAAATRFGAALIPEFREGHFVVQVVGPTGSSLQEMTRLGERVSRQVLEIPGVKTVSQQVGRAELGEDTWSPNRSEFHVELAPDLPARDQIRIEEALRSTFAQYPSLQSEVVTFLGDRISESLSGVTAAMSVSIFGTDLDRIDATALAVAATLRAVPGTTDVQLDLAAGQPMVTVQPRAERLAAFGMRPVDLFETVAVAYQGDAVAQVYEANQALAVRVVLNASDRRDPESVRDLRVRTPSGRELPLSALADVTLESGRSRILHESGQRRQVVTLNATTSDVVGLVEAAERAVAEKVKLPQGVYLKFGGAAEAASAASRDLALHSSIAAVGVLLVLMLAFPDWRSIVLILINVPFALVGGVIAVALGGGSVSIGSLVGFVTLFGISARNTIMLISHYAHLIGIEGARWGLQTVLRGARERLTPILMTAVVTALGLLPLALGSGEAGREVEGPMASVILGGLISSTVLNLLVMPALVLRYLRPEALRGAQR